MPSIHVLSPEVIARIAAGEVIERPAFVLKELVENAIDAGATQITVAIEKSGMNRIRVTDNGMGMDTEDLQLAILPHTTSKLSNTDDLFSIQSLGFRGEALASIASVSEIVINSRTQGNISGYTLSASRGRTQLRPHGMKIGTQVIVSDLFSTVPARKKFLKTPQTELRRCNEIMMHFALSYPHISWKYIHNSKQLFSLTTQASLEQRVRYLFGESIWNSLLPLTYEDSYIKIKGFLGRPQTAGGSVKHHVFVNCRPVIDPLISSAITESYGNLLEMGSTPFALIFIEVPPSFVDVNVHPQKLSVRFADPSLMHSQMSLAVKDTLSANNLSFANLSFQISNRAGTTKLPIATQLSAEIKPWQLSPIQQKHSFITQLHNTYILMQTEKGLLCFDQHAAHERILYNQFEKMLEEKKQQNLISPCTPPLLLSVTRSDMLLFTEYEQVFLDLGFDIESFDETTLRMNAVPLVFAGFPMEVLFAEILEDLASGKKVRSTDRTTHRMLATLACKAAIKAGQELSEDEMCSLVEKLQLEKNAATCPHGRPTHIEIPLGDLHHLFKRK